MSNKKSIVYIDDVLLVCDDCITNKERNHLRKEHTLVAEATKAYKTTFASAVKGDSASSFPAKREQATKPARKRYKA